MLERDLHPFIARSKLGTDFASVMLALRKGDYQNHFLASINMANSHGFEKTLDLGGWYVKAAQALSAALLLCRERSPSAALGRLAAAGGVVH